MLVMRVPALRTQPVHNRAVIQQLHRLAQMAQQRVLMRQQQHRDIHRLVRDIALGVPAEQMGRLRVQVVIPGAAKFGEHVMRHHARPDII